MRIFGDPTLRNVNDGFFEWSPLAVPVERDPDEWIPQIAALVGNENREIHDNAVDVLVRFHSRRARADALRPLLPWLTDPQWSSARDRMRLIQSVDRVGLTEAIPGLIRVVEAEQGEMRAYAVDSLGSLRAKEAVPALRRALEQSDDPHHRYLIIKSLTGMRRGERGGDGRGHRGLRHPTEHARRPGGFRRAGLRGLRPR